MVEADNHLRLLPTSIEHIYKVFDCISMLSMFIWGNPDTYTVHTLAKLAQIWAFRVTCACGVGMMPLHHG